MVRANPGDYFNRAELLEDLQAVSTLYRDHGYANVEATPQTNVDPENHEVDVIVPVVRGPLVHFERIEVRGNTKTRDKVIRRELEVAEGEPFQRDQARALAAARHGARLLRARRHRRPSRARPPTRSTSTSRSPRSRPAPSRSAPASPASKTSSPRLRSSRPTCSATARACRSRRQMSGIRQLVNLRFYEPYFLDSRFSASIDLYDQLRIYRDFSQSSLGGGLTFGYPLIEPELTRLRHLHGRARRGVDRTALHAPRHGVADQRLQPAAARQPVQRRLHLQHPPGARSTTPATTGCFRRAASTCSARASSPPAFWARKTSSCATAWSAASTTRSGPASCSSSTPRRATSPARRRKACRSSRASSSAASSTCAASATARIGPRVGAYRIDRPRTACRSGTAPTSAET